MMDAQTSDVSALDDREPSRPVVITTLGLTQIFAWGCTFYLPAVLAKPIAIDTGWPLVQVVSGVSVGLLAAGMVSPRVGRMIDQKGGRPVLALSSALLAAGLTLVGLAQSIPVYLAAWLVIGAGMGCGLYDAAFSTLGRYYGKEARSAIATLTLWGGFASTICWPLSAYLVEIVGWRGVCFTYAALQLGLALPAHLVLLPRLRRPAATAPEPSQVSRPSGLPAPRQAGAFLMLACVVTLAGAVSSLFSVHLLTLLQARDVTLGEAVALGALVGPAQVGARLVEMTFGRHYHPIWTMFSAVVLVAAGLALLALGLPLFAASLILYGAGNGIYSIGRGTLPLTLFGPSRYARLMGRLALPSLLAQALSPALGALLIQHGGAGRTFGILTGLAAANIVLVAILWAMCRSRPVS
jgi:predicted MFS family arabinose efflux permease